MTGDLSLSIRLLDQSNGRYALALSVRNESSKRLLIPAPELTGLRFRRVDNSEDAKWATWTLQTSRWKGILLEPSEAQELTFSAVALSAKRRPTEEEIMTGRNDIWWVDLRPGAYDVTYLFHVGDDYVDPDSHYGLPQVRKVAESEGAEVWMGDAVSNEVRVVHA